MPTKTTAKPKPPAEVLAALHARRTQLRAEQRRELLNLQHAEREHQQFERTIQVARDRAVALNETAPSKADTTALEAAADRLEHATEQVGQYERALGVVDEEILATRRDNADELLHEQLATHSDTAERISDLTARLAAELETAHACYVNAQTILRDAGRNETTARLRVTPSIDQIVRDGGIAPLLNPQDVRSAA